MVWGKTSTPIPSRKLQLNREGGLVGEVVTSRIRRILVQTAPDAQLGFGVQPG